jgi:Polyketide cyclase / dehydrase and lipid transport
MKHLDGRADAVVNVPIATCFSVLAAVERYPDWSGEFIRAVTVLDRDAGGLPVRAHVIVHVAQSPFGKTFEFDAAIRAEPPRAVHVTRLPGGPSHPDRFSVSWLLHGEGHGTRIELEFAATVSFLPGLLPLPGVGELVARSLLDAAVRELGGSSAPPRGAPSSM